MKIRTEQEKERYLYCALCVAALAVTLFPVSCSYIMDSGIVREWIARVEEMASGLQGGHLYFYPSQEVFAVTGIKQNAMNSNLWFLLPGVLYRLTGNMVFSYRVFMPVVQIGTLFTAMLFFRRVFARVETRLPACLGIILYMCSPYRIYVCYDFANLSQAVAWMLLPLYAWALSGLLGKKGNWKEGLTAAVSLAGIGYADVIFFVTLAGITLLLGLLKRKPWSLVPLAAGSILFLPGLYRLGAYLFSDAFQELELPMQSIMQKGYRLGEYFSSYSYRDGRPGLGLGMLTGLAVLVWIRVVAGKKSKTGNGFALLSIFFLALSFHRFPWDMVERLGGWAMKLVSLIDTPAVFFGMAFFCLCVPSAQGAEELGRQENRRNALAVSVIVLLFSLGLCVYQCNTLTYNRLPLVLGQA